MEENIFVELKDLFKYHYISNLKINNSKDKLAFVVTRQDEKTNSYLSNIWIMDLASKKCFQITNKGKESVYFWYSDKEIVFSSVDENNKRNHTKELTTQFYIVDINELKIEPFFQIPSTVLKIEKLDDNNFAFISLKEENKEVINNNVSINNISNVSFLSTDKLPIWSNGVEDFSYKKLKLCIFNKETNKIKSLSKSTQVIDNFIINENFILYTVSNYESVLSWSHALYLYNFTTDDTKCIVPMNHCVVKYANFIDKNKLVIVMSDCQKFGYNQNPKFYFYKITGITPERIVENDTSCTNTIVTDCRFGTNKEMIVKDNKLYFLTTVNESCNLMSLDIFGNIKQITNIEGSIESFEFDKDNNLYLIAFNKNKLQEIYLYEKNKIKQLTHFNESFLENKKLSKITKLSIFKKDVRIDGFVYLPINFDKSKKYPAILLIHGGPKAVYSNIYDHEINFLTSLGYFVICCNPRGSDGKGNEYADIRGKYGSIDYQDLMDFTNYSLDYFKDNIYKSKVSIMGGSYGGFMVNWIIGKTNFFKCAISMRGISSWISMYGTSDIGYLFAEDQAKGTIWNNLDKVIKNSPIVYANKIKTPTLFMHSDKDYRCHYVESLQMYTALKKHNVKTKFVLFKNENHNLSRSGKPLNRVLRLKLIAEWLKENM